MEMVSLKLPKKSKKEMTGDMPVMAEQPKYPYGFRLTFDAEQVAKIPHLKSVKIGEKVTIQAMGEVIQVSKMERQNDKNQFSVEVQLTDIGVGGKEKDPLKGSLTEAIRKSQSGLK